MTEKELEKLFKSKLNNREFAFNPENWQKMEAILDDSAVAKGWYFWRSSAAIVLFGAVVATLIYFSPNARIDSVASDQLLTPQKSKVEEIYQDPSQKELNSSQQEITAPDEAIAADQYIAASPEQQIKDIPENSSSISEQAPSQPLTSPAQEQSVAALTNKADVPENQYNDGLANSSEKQNITDDPVFAAASPIATRKNAVKVDALDFVLLTSKGYDGLNIEPVNLDFLNSDLNVVANNNEFIDKSRTPVGVFVNGGLVFTGSNTNNTLGTGYHAGIGYRKGLNYGLVLETGISYVVLNDVNIQDNSDSVFFGFGVERIETEEINKRLDYIEVPLNVSYRVTPKHSLGIGAYASILVNISRDVETKRYTPKGGMAVSNHQSNGYQEEFDRFDLGFNAFYRYAMTPRFNVGLHFKTGLRDITKDVSVDYAEDHTNFNTRIVLEYSLF